MIRTRGHVERPDGTIITSIFDMQIELISPGTHLDVSFDRPALLAEIYLAYQPTVAILTGDLLVDDVNVDPITLSSVRYRVTQVEQMFRTRVEIHAHLIIGS